MVLALTAGAVLAANLLGRETRTVGFQTMSFRAAAPWLECHFLLFLLLFDILLVVHTIWLFLLLLLASCEFR
jgi:hypothetical protein